jgi:hypothetical protein
LCFGENASGDTDADGICDNLDACPGSDDNVDSDADGVPDGCDLCPGFDDTVDCNTNGIPDGCDLQNSGARQDFDGGSGAAFATAGSAFPSGGSMLLTQDFQNLTGSVVFETLSPRLVGSFTAEFEFKINSSVNGADGMSFSLLDVGVHGPTALFGEDGPGAASLAISFDIFQNTGEPSGNFVEILLNGGSIATADPGFTMDNNTWHHADITFDGTALTMTLTPGGGSAATVFNAVPVPGYVPIVGRFGFGARTGGFTAEHRVDTVRIIDTSNTNDCDSNGVPDPCDPDADNDTAPDACDQCPAADDRLDGDSDGAPDGCDICPGGDDNLDTDGDTLPNACDNCPFDSNFDQTDSDSDGVGDACDQCQGFDDSLDSDFDGVPDGCDVCDGFDDTLDADSDSVPDDCDNCPTLANADQADCDSDGIGDVCALAPAATACGGSNASFETGDFTDWTAQEIAGPFFPLSVGGAGISPGFGFFVSAPTDGSFAVLHGFDGSGPGNIRVSQSFALPADSSELLFDYRGAWNLTFGATQDRSFDVVVTSGGDTVFPILTAVAGTIVNDTGSQTASIDLSAFAGSTVTITFDWTIPEASTGPGFFQLDNIRCVGIGESDCDTNGVPDSCDPDTDGDSVPDACDAVNCSGTCGDINGSGGSVDLVDFASFAVCFGLSPNSSVACACSDMNHDGAINLQDFATFSLIFNAVSTNTVPNCP